MKKTLAILILAAAAATPALASDGSEAVMHSKGQPSYAMSNGMAAYASARDSNWQPAQNADIRRPGWMEWQLIDR